MNFSRYHRQLLLPDFDESAQTKLKESTVLVVGAGGLACSLLQYLVASGIGNITIIDGDKVELSNLHRQVLYDENDLLNYKAEVAKRKLEKQNSEVKILGICEYFSKVNGFELVRNHDLVVDTTDNLETKYLINDICYLYKKPLIFGAIFQYEGQVSTFHYPNKDGVSYNYRDIFPEIPNDGEISNCSESGVLAPIVGIISMIQASEVINCITKINFPLAGKLYVFSLRNYLSATYNIAKNNSVFLPNQEQDIYNEEYVLKCSNFEYKEIKTKEDFDKIISLESTCLIDVRNLEELPRLKNKNLIEKNSTEIENIDISDFKNIIVVCQSGIRSKKVIEKLTKKFPLKKYYNIYNGIKTIYE
ncbi:MAG: ThiF family adenylyltransferase [Flavobacteriales bacterium]|nr:ThiF family adenylyltransferase [Flavobacteriales bacterium]